MVEFNDASKKAWQYLVGRHIGVDEIPDDALLRMYMELDGITGDIIWPGYAEGSQRDLEWVSIKQYGAVGDGVADDTAAIQAALDSEKLIYVPEGTFVSDGLVLNAKTKVRIDMVGRIKRKDNSARLALLNIYNCTDVVINAFRSDGNVANNFFGGLPVDEAKHDLRIDGSDDVVVGLVDSINPAGDGVYITGSSERVSLGTVRSQSDTATGRNTLSIVSGVKIAVTSVECHGTGYATMPGGFDIEPNNGQIVDDVTVGKIYARTSGTGGFTAYGLYPPGGGQYQINRVKIGPVILVKGTGVAGGACDVPILGVKDFSVESVLIDQDAAATNQALTIDNSDRVRMHVDIPASRGATPPTIGATGEVTNLKLTGSILQSGSHCLNIYRLSDSDINMKLRGAASGVLIVKQATGSNSINVRWSGDWRKIAGAACMQINGTVEWQVDADRRDWASNELVIGAGAAGVTNKSPLSQSVYTFTAPGQTAWTCPLGAKSIRVTAVGAGGGGGSGRRDAAGTTRFGGGGGAAGSRTETVLDGATYAGTAFTVTVGAAGVGGAAVAVDATSGNNGTAGGWSGLGIGALQANTLVNANGGNAGTGGTGAAGTAGTGVSGSWIGSTGGAGSNGSVAGGTVSFAAGMTGGGGGGGGGITAANAAAAGGGGGFPATGYPGNTAGGAAGANGSNGAAVPFPTHGYGGGGGGASNGGAAGNGGNGSAPGAGGGGGGASVNGTNSGAGGNGGNGGVQIIVTY